MKSMPDAPQRSSVIVELAKPELFMRQENSGIESWRINDLRAK
jgi:hypothetical protein